jgi:hypothetical protein
MVPIIEEDFSDAKKKLEYENEASTSKKVNCNFGICFDDKKSLDNIKRKRSFSESTTFLKNSFGIAPDINTF